MPVGDPTSIVGKRIGAAVIDVVVFLGIVLTLAFVVNHDTIEQSEILGFGCGDVRDNGGTNLCFESGDKLYYAEGDKARADYGVMFLAWFLNNAILQGATGASIGKHMVGLRVIKKDTGQLASIGPSALRWLVGLLDICFCFLIGLIMVLTTKGHRRLGDMAANTLVVGKDSVGVAPAVPGLTAPEFTGGPYATAYPPAGSPFTPPQPASPTGWPPPTTSTPPPPAPPTAPVAETPAANTPTWDPQRNTYVIFDAAQNQWMQWDDTSQQWRPISQ